MSKEVKDTWSTEEARAERKARLKSLKTASGGKKKIRKRVSPLVIVGIIAILAVLAAALFYTLLQNGWRETRTTAAVVNGKKVTALEANFILGNYYQGTTRLPAFSDKGKELLHSVMPMGDKLQPLRDSMLEAFEEQITDVYGFSEKAEKEGMTLSEEGRQQVDTYFIQIANAAMQNQMTVGDFTKQLFGPGASEKTIRPLLEKALLAAQYQNEKLLATDVSDAEIEEEYNNNPDEYDSVSFYSFNFNAATPLEKQIDEEEEKKDEKDEKPATDDEATIDAEEVEDETEEEPTPEELAAKLKANAEGMLENVKDVESFLKEAMSYATEDDRALIEEENALFVEKAFKQNLSPEYSAWLFDEDRKEGDKEIIENKGTYSVLYFMGRERDEAPSFNSRHILVLIDPEAEDQETAKAEAQTKAEDILKRYRDGEQTEDAFAKLATEFSDDGGSKDNGGLYEKVSPGNFVKPYEEWCLDSERREGDVEIVFVESANYSGYHIIYFIGLDDPMWKNTCSQVVRNEKFAEYLESERKNFSYREIEEGMKLVLPADEALLESARESLREVGVADVQIISDESDTDENEAETSQEE